MHEIRARAQLLNPLPGPPPARRILVIRLGALGDVVRTRFAFSALRELYPGARIDWLVGERAAGGLAGIVGLDHVIELPRSTLDLGHPFRALRGLRRLQAELRTVRYDLSVDFHGSLKSALFAYGSGIPIRAGYAAGLAREGSHRLLTHRASVEPRHLSRYERNAFLVEYLGGSRPSVPPALDLPEHVSGLEELPDRPLILHPGTSATTRYKRWELSRYAALARQLEECLDATSVVTWGPVAGEREDAQEVVRLAEGAAVLAPPLGGPSELLVLLRSARLFIGSDSGPAHLASLAGTPSLLLFGPTDTLENAPFGGVLSRVLRHDVGCNPCRKGCPDRTCMRSIHVEEAVRAARELIVARSTVGNAFPGLPQSS